MAKFGFTPLISITLMSMMVEGVHCMLTTRPTFTLSTLTQMNRKVGHKDAARAKQTTWHCDYCNQYQQCYQMLYQDNVWEDYHILCLVREKFKLCKNKVHAAHPDIDK